MKASLYYQIAALAFVTSAFSQPALADQPPLPLRLENCQRTTSAASGDVDYNQCYTYDPASQYGQVYITFKMDEFDFKTLAGQMDRQQKQQLTKMIRSLFMSSSKSGDLILQLTLNPGNGLPNVPLGIIPLASFKKTDGGGLAITRSAQHLDGFFGPSFAAGPNTQVKAELRYLYSKDKTSHLSSAIGEASKFFSGLGLLTETMIKSGKLADALKPLDGLLDKKLDRTDTTVLPIQLSVDPLSQMAVYRNVSLNGIPHTDGHLYVGLARIRSVLFMPPKEDLPLVFPFPGYGLAARDRVLDHMIDGTKLRDHIQKAMGADFAKLQDPFSAATFLAGASALETAINGTSSALGLLQDDKLALRWAMIAGNPLLKDPAVRNNYLIAQLEDDLARVKLAVPPVDTVLTNQQKQWLELGQKYSDEAKAIQDKANAAVSDGTDAENSAKLPARAAGHVSLPASVNGGKFAYFGEEPPTSGRYHGAFEYPSGGRYVGSFISTAPPIFDGYGRYTGGSAEPDLDYYVGEFVANRFSGLGMMRWKDGREFYGQFANDEPNGYGIEFGAGGADAYYVRYSAGIRDQAAIRKQSTSPALQPGKFIGRSFVVGAN